MAAFDLAGVASQARSGVVPNDWTLFPLRRRSALFNFLGGVVLCLVVLGIAVYLFLSKTAYVPKFLPDSFFSDSGIATASIIESLLFVALGVWMAVLAVRWFRAYSDHQSYFIVVTPEGFAEVKGEKDEGAAFAEVTGLRQRSGFFGLEFEVKRRAGAALTLEVVNNYGPPRDVLAALQNGLRVARQA
jgi:uncharacterized membrane protein